MSEKLKNVAGCFVWKNGWEVSDNSIIELVASGCDDVLQYIGVNSELTAAHLISYEFSDHIYSDDHVMESFTKLKNSIKSLNPVIEVVKIIGGLSDNTGSDAVRKKIIDRVCEGGVFDLGFYGYIGMGLSIVGKLKQSEVDMIESIHGNRGLIDFLEEKVSEFKSSDLTGRTYEQNLRAVLGFRVVNTLLDKFIRLV